ncbi:hypothetical protein Godav_029095 [Gossypium davidsonii]|uniref:Uncharacterized protein n=1 Tax=Gossypium davidsonii TaxID=34287 RepID=A0A7J8TAS8_GOSDV|nr:hypothetical protein [Gossypium davidsonii]
MWMKQLQICLTGSIRGSHRSQLFWLKLSDL